MTDDELRALLHGADPAASLPPADPDRVADLLEDAVSTTRPTPAAPVELPAARRRRPRPFVVALAAAAAAVVVAAVAVPVVRSMTASEPVTTTLTAQPFDPASSDCMPVGEFLSDLQVAFAGTVTSVEGDRVVLDVTRTYQGEPGDRVVIDAPHQDEQSAATVGGFPFEVGGDYLVGATDGVVAVCGASGPATPELQAEYERAFG